MKLRNNNFEYPSVFGRKPRSSHGLILFIVSFFMCTNAFAQEKPNLAKLKVVVPDHIAGVTTVSAEQLIEILASDKPPMLIDARITEDRDYGIFYSC